MRNQQLLFVLLLLLLSNCSTFEDDFNQFPQLVEFLEVDTHLPIINITADKKDFDNLMNEPDKDIEIQGVFNLFRNGELMVANEVVELEIKGNFSTKYTLKSLGIKFEDKYDNKDRSLIHPPLILPHHNLDEIKAIRLRNSGSDFENTMLKDLSVTQLAIQAELDLDLTYGEPTLVYINEAFYGLMNLRTEANTNGMAGLYGVKKKDITLAKITTQALIKKDGDFDRIDQFVAAIERKDLRYIEQELDLNNFIDYMIFESYIGNTDWPHNNARFYAIKDGPFRFVLFDLDKVAWLKMDKSPLKIIHNPLRSSLLSDLFSTLYEDPSFKQTFWDRYHALLDDGNIGIEPFQTIVEKNATQIREVIPLQIDKHQFPGSLTEWDIELDKLLTLFKERALVVHGFIEAQ